MEGRKNHVDVGILSVIKFGRSGLCDWAAKSWVWESNLTITKHVCGAMDADSLWWSQLCCFGSSPASQICLLQCAVNMWSWRCHWIEYDKMCFLCLKVRGKMILEHLSSAMNTFPIISKCSCLLKSIAFPLKNHLNLGFRDESLDTSQGKTRLCPVVTSKLRGGTIILVGSTSSKQEKKNKQKTITCCL